MEAAKNRRRLIVLTIVVILCFVGLGCRLVELQWTRHDEFAALAENQHGRSYFREAPRGDVRDRRGNLLATSIPVKTVCADPSLLKGFEADMARVLAPLLSTNETAVFAILNKHLKTNSLGLPVDNKYERLKHKVSVEDWEKIRLALNARYTNAIGGRKLTSKEKVALQGAWLRSITPEDDQVRSYPNGALAAHILGFTGPRETVVHDRTNIVSAGWEGIEATFDEKLRGARGWVKTETDIARRELYMFREADVESRPGLSVVLTIDARIQQIVEEELAPMFTKHSAVSATAIIIRPKTGEIVAMATLPNFDPNDPGKHRDPAVRRNRAITDSFEPGSTFKTVTLAGALDDGIVRLSDRFDCENGAFRFAGFTLHDHDNYNTLTVEEIIAKSSNIGTAKVALKMGKEATYKHIVNFGFGERTGIPLTGEVRGVLPKMKDWKPIHLSRIPIGQGVSATPIQTAMAVAAVANGGVLMRPMIVDRLVDDKGHTVMKYQSQSVRRVISYAAAVATTAAMKTVVEKGTADKAALEHYTVAGKTGTAQKVVGGDYSHDKYYASFIGFFPTDEPELLIYISCDEPVKKSGYYGGTVCAPVFKRIAERTANFLNIKPDIQPPETDSLMASDAAPSRSSVTQVSRP
ncbi:MAG TPA: penicillin-binding protein 2 [Candidatus Acidoferrum sp.]|nr:penicillin-binding protein 2 [Candidatus Acidoferrum sp.]